MEAQKIVDLLNDSDNESSRFAKIRRYIINDQDSSNKWGALGRFGSKSPNF